MLKAQEEMKQLFIQNHKMQDGSVAAVSEAGFFSIGEATDDLFADARSFSTHQALFAEDKRRCNPSKEELSQMITEIQRSLPPEAVTLILQEHRNIEGYSVGSVTEQRQKHHKEIGSAIES